MTIPFIVIALAIIVFCFWFLFGPLMALWYLLDARARRTIWREDDTMALLIIASTTIFIAILAHKIHLTLESYFYPRAVAGLPSGICRNQPPQSQKDHLS